MRKKNFKRKMPSKKFLFLSLIYVSVPLAGNNKLKTFDTDKEGIQASRSFIFVKKKIVWKFYFPRIFHHSWKIMLAILIRKMYAHNCGTVIYQKIEIKRLFLIFLFGIWIILVLPILRGLARSYRYQTKKIWQFVAWLSWQEHPLVNFKSLSFDIIIINSFVHY